MAATATSTFSALDLSCPPGPHGQLTRAVLLVSGSGLLTANDLCSLAATCSELHRCAAGVPAFWSVLDFSQLARPTAFWQLGMPAAKRFGGVRELILQFCDGLRDEHLAQLPPALSRLRLDSCPAITDDGVRALAASCGPRLEELSLYWNNNVSDSGVAALALKCPRLTALSLSGCKLVGSASVLALASRCRLLGALNLTRLPLVDDVALGAVVQANPRLATLRLYAASQYSDAPLVMLAQRCARLAVLDCTGLNLLTDGALTALGAGCPALRQLTLSWVTRLTDVGVCAVAAACPLELLSLHGLRNVGEPSLRALAEHRTRSLTALDVRGCIGMPRRSPAELLEKLPRLCTFILHT